MRETPLLDLIYPRRCPMCQEIVPAGIDGWNGNNLLICSDCRERLPYLQPPYCLKCGKEVEQEDREYCYDCSRQLRHYRKGYPVLHYRGECRKGMEAFKYHNRREYAQFYGEIIAERHGRELTELKLDGIVPVPIHRHKKRKRGYNQAEMIARELGIRIHVLCYPDCLIRTADTTPQKELNDVQRLENLKNAFLFRENHVELKKVLLVDDIYTTGATIEACTLALLAGGVAEVYYTSVCIGSNLST